MKKVSLKAIKNLIFESDGNSEPEEKKVVEKSIPEPIKPAIQPTIQPSIPIDALAGKPDNTISDKLTEAIEKANIEGVDYFEFAKILQGLTSSIPAEQMRYQAAFASVVAMNATKKLLLDTADHYLNVLSVESENFAKIVAQQTLETVNKKEETLSTIDNVIKEKTEMMNQLTAEINQLATEKTNITNEIAENKLSIEKVQNNFAATLKIFIDKINSDKSKIQQYIAG